MHKPTLSVVIPSATGSRGGNVERLLGDIHRQTLPPKDVHVVRGVSPAGRARNEGARLATGDVVCFLDDDVRLGHDRLFEAMVDCLLGGFDIAMVGAAQLLPPDSTWFQRAAAQQTLRSVSPVVRVPTDSDMATTACCVIRRDVVGRLGGFHEGLPRGEDTEMRHRLRGLGLRILVAPDAWFYHPMPASPRKLLAIFWRNGQQSAEAERRVPWAALENPEGHTSHFVARRGRAYRAVRHGARLLSGVVTLRWIGVAAQMAYLLGTLSYLASRGRRTLPPPGASRVPDR